MTHYLCLALTILLLVNPAYSSIHQPDRSTQASAVSVSPQTSNEIVAAIVKAQKANLRDRPSNAGSILTTVSRGDLLALIDITPVGPWYQVRDPRTDSRGWIHGNAIVLLQTVEAPRRTSPPVSGRSYINVDGVRVLSPVFSETKPAGATARCRDGSYSFSLHRRGTCSYHGGVAEWF